MFKVFRVTTRKWEKNLKFKVYRTFSNALKFQILSFKRSLKWICAWNKSCSIWSFEQFSYSKVFRLTSGTRRKIEFTNWTLELRVNYESAITISLPPLFPLTPWWRRADAIRRRRHRPATCWALAKTASPAPGFAHTPASLAPSALATRPRWPSARHAVERRRLTVAAPLSLPLF